MFTEQKPTDASFTKKPHDSTESQEELIAREFDGNTLAPKTSVLEVLGKMKFGRFETGEELKSPGNKELGAVAMKQVIELHHYLPDNASGVVIQGRGIGAGTSDASYPWQKHPEQMPEDPRDKGMDAAFASAIAAGLSAKEDAPIGVILPTLPGHAADTYHQNNESQNNKLSWRQVGALLRGDNRPVADAQATAIWNLLEETDQTNTPVHVVGASLSTAQAPEIGANLLKRGTNVASINLIEAVNIEKQKFFGVGLLPAIIKASLRFGLYLDANHRVYQESKGKMGTGELGFVDGMKKLLGVTSLYAVSLHGEAQEAFRDKEVIEKANEKGTVINLAYGTASEFKTKEQSERAAEALRKLGYKNVITTPFENGLHAISVSGSAFVDTVAESIEHSKAA